MEKTLTTLSGAGSLEIILYVLLIIINLIVYNTPLYNNSVYQLI